MVVKYIGGKYFRICIICKDRVVMGWRHPCGVFMEGAEAS